MKPVLRAVAAFVALLLLVGLAWVASNLKDVEPRPVPPELALALPQAGSSSFLRMQGLLAPAGADALQAGREAWAQLQQPRPAGGALPSSPPGLPGLQGLPAACGAGQDCTAALSGDVAALARQLEPHAWLGQRCEALAAERGFAEGLPASLGADTLLPSYGGWVQCGHWFRGQASLAAAQGDQERALAYLSRDLALGHDQMAGSRTLIGHMIAAAVLRNAYHGVAAVHLRQPSWAGALAPLVAAPVAIDHRRWIVTEAAFVRGTLFAPGRGCQRSAWSESPEAASGWMDGACRLGLGYLPEATRQQVDARWLAVWQQAGAGPDAFIDASLARRAEREAAPQSLAWRNTVGQAIADLAEPALEHYLLRLADVELHRLTLSLALQAAAAGVPEAERDAWLQREAIAPRQRARLQWEDAGRVLTGRTWFSELPGSDPRRQPVRVPVPSRVPLS